MATAALSATITGTSAAETLYGDPGSVTQSDNISGLAGNDTLIGLNMADVLIGGTGDDVLYGGYDNDTLQGDAGNDTLYGEQDNDTLYGNDGNDMLYGQQSNDTLVGGYGQDTLMGDDPYSMGAADTFVFTTLQSGIYDLVADFGKDGVTDLFNFDRAVFTSLPAGTIPAANYVAGAAPLDNNDYIAYDRTTGQVRYAPSGNAGAVYVIAVVSTTYAGNVSRSSFIGL